MLSAVAIFVLSIPLSIELGGRLLALRDVWRVRESRPQAILRLIVPLVLLGMVTAWALPEHSLALIAGLALAPIWQLVTGYALRVALRFPAFQTRAVSSRPERT